MNEDEKADSRTGCDTAYQPQTARATWAVMAGPEARAVDQRRRRAPPELPSWRQPLKRRLIGGWHLMYPSQPTEASEAKYLSCNTPESPFNNSVPAPTCGRFETAISQPPQRCWKTFSTLPRAWKGRRPNLRPNSSDVGLLVPFHMRWHKLMVSADVPPDLKWEDVADELVGLDGSVSQLPGKAVSFTRPFANDLGPQGHGVSASTAGVSGCQGLGRGIGCHTENRALRGQEHSAHLQSQ